MLSPTEQQGLVSEGLRNGNSAVAGPFHFVVQAEPAESILVEALRRSIEIVLAVTVLTAGLPVLLLLALAIRWDSPGPALFRQIRIGKGRRPFVFFKFRTFYADAKQRFPELYEYKYTPDEVSNLDFKNDNDPRVTRIGRWLRKSTLDELPNFINVLLGDASVVGPRPEIPEMLPYYSQEELLKFHVKPGLTGLAQVSGRNHLRFKETNALDVQYVRERSWKLDLRIFWKTTWCIVTRRGAL